MAARGLAPSGQRRPAACAADDFHDVAEQRRLDFDAADFRARLCQGFGGKRGEIGGVEVVRVKTLVHGLKDGDFLFGCGISDLDLQQEAVQLRFRQRIRAFKLDWVLCGEDGEKLRKVVRARRRW